MHISKRLILPLLCLVTAMASFAQKRIYIAPDDHTDYMWTADEDAYREAMLRMIDYYLDLNDSTATAPYAYQNKWNCDGSYWLYTYSKHRSEEQFLRLLRQIREERITVPMNSLISVMGVAPLEATLRDMYYAGTMQRRYSLPFEMALNMEDQVLPLGLSSLWAGSGAKYSWRGVCACVTDVKGLDNRPNEVYWYTGLDDQRVMMKWYSVNPKFIKKPTVFRYNIGKYLEADNVPNAILDCQEILADRVRYPYDAVAAFGKGGDALQTITDEFPRIARKASSDEYQVIVSNELDFFRDMEKHYGKQLPTESLSYGSTEWGTAVASMAQLSADVKRAVEKLRTAELMYTLVAHHDASFASDLEQMRREAWFACGLYYEHDWTADSPDVTRKQRAEWQRRIAAQLLSYVDTLYESAHARLSQIICGDNSFFVLNPLGWQRTDYCDYEYSGSHDIHVIDNVTGENVPMQWIEKDGKSYLRILASNVPSMGYKTYAIRNDVMPVSASEFVFADNTLSNDDYELRLNKQGSITSLIDKRNGNADVIRAIDGRTANDLGMPKRAKTDRGSDIRLISNGPVSATIEASSYFPLKHTTRVTLFNGIDRIEIENLIDENFGNKQQTYAYSFDIEKPVVHTEEAGAILKVRQASQGGHYADSICRLDWVALNHFADISGEGKGVMLSNRDAYFMKTGRSTIDSLDVDTPQLNVLAGGKVNTWLGIENQDGESLLRNDFALRTYCKEYNAAESMRFALEHQNPLVAGSTSPHSENLLSPANSPHRGGDAEGRRGLFSLCSVSDPNILIWTVKPSEEGIQNGVIMRLWNVSDADTSFTLNTGWTMERASLATHIETDNKPLQIKKGKLPMKLGHNKIQTIRINF